MKSRSPHASILALLKDRDIEKAVEIEERQKGASNVVSLRKQPLSSQAMKLIYGNDGTYIHHSSVDDKLAAWKQEYLKRRSEPKKYEPMLYFLDLYNVKVQPKVSV
jgi:hypothetical protein